MLTSIEVVALLRDLKFLENWISKILLNNVLILQIMLLLLTSIEVSDRHEMPLHYSSDLIIGRTTSLSFT